MIRQLWSTHSGAEIDLLLHLNGRRIGIECKLSEAPTATKAMHIATEDLHLDKLFVAYPGSGGFPLSERIEVQSVPMLVEGLNRT